MNIEVDSTVAKKIVATAEDDNIDFSVSIDYEYFHISDPTFSPKSFVVSIKENEEYQVWGTIVVASSDGDMPPDANFTITKETDTYIEGTFYFQGMRLDPNTGEIADTINVTNGKFKAKKTY